MSTIVKVDGLDEKGYGGGRGRDNSCAAARSKCVWSWWAQLGVEIGRAHV